MHAPVCRLLRASSTVGTERIIIDRTSLVTGGTEPLRLVAAVLPSERHTVFVSRGTVARVSVGSIPTGCVRVLNARRPVKALVIVGTRLVRDLAVYAQPSVWTIALLGN